jgi:hypothetical protein
MDPATAQAIEQGLAFGQGQQGQERQSAISQQLSGQGAYKSGYSPEFIRQQLLDLYVNPAMRAWEQDIAPGLGNYFAGTEAYRSGDIMRAISQAGEGVGIGAVTQQAGLTENELQRQFLSGENAMQRQQSAIPLSSEEEKAPIRFGMLAGDQRRGIASEQAQFDIQKELRNTPWANPALGMAPLILGQYRTPSTGDSSFDWGGLVSGLVNPVGGMMGGGGGGGGMF